MRSLTILICLAVMCALLAIVGQADAETIIVDDDWDGADYSSIAEATEEASAGDTVRVYAGTYVLVEGDNAYSATSFPIFLNKRINLIGNGSSDTIIDGWTWVDHAHNIHVSAGGCIIEGFTIKGSSVHHEFGGIGLYASNTKILNCTFENNNWAINFLGGNKATISNCTFIRNRKNIICYESAGKDTITGNTFEDSSASYSGNNSTFTNNTGSSISLSGSNNLIRDNHFDGSGAGLSIFGSYNNVNNNTMIGNRASGNWTYGRGLYISSHSDRNNIENNTIADNSVGIYILGSRRLPDTGLESRPAKDNRIHHNNIYGNDIGIDAVTNFDGVTYADDNWWGDPSGPNGTGFNGSGDWVSNNTIIDSWLTIPMDLYIYPTASIITEMGRWENHPIIWNKTFQLVGFGAGEIVRYVWHSSIDQEIYNGTESAFNTSTLSPGKHTISLRVQNSADEWGRWTRKYLYVNMRPVILNATITPRKVMIGEYVSFNVTAKDYDGYIREWDYFWNSDLQGELLYPQIEDDKGNFTRWAPMAGHHNISVTVRDNWMIMSHPFNVTLTVIQRPYGYFVPAWNLIMETDGNLTLECHGRDLDGSIVQWSIVSDIDGTIYNGSSLPVHNGTITKYIVYTFEGLSKGTHNMTLALLDNDGLWSLPYTRPLIVHDRPLASIDGIHPNPALEGDYVQMNGSAIDDGWIELYVWRSDLDGEIYNGTNSSFVTCNLSFGDHRIFFKAKDNYGAWSHEANSSISITEAPVATIVDISPSPALIGETVVFTGKGHHSNGTIVSYVWNSTLEGVIGRTTNITLSNLTKGKHRITFTVRDSVGIWSVPKKATLIVHEKPIAVIDGIDPEPGLEGDPITFSGTGVDDDFIMRYVWLSSIDGEFLNGTEDEQTTSSLSFGKHTIWLKVLDHNGAWSDEVNVTFWVNAMPIADILLINPDPAIYGENITFTGEGRHSNGTIVGFKWESNIDGVLGRVAETTLANLTKGDHNISLSVVDGQDVWSRAKYYYLPVLERPVATIRWITPNPVTEGEMITFNGSGSGERTITTLQWWIDGDYMSANPEMKIPDLDAGEHTVALRVMDEMGIWSLDATEVLVVNAVPEALIVSIYPDPANATERVHFIGGYNDFEDNVTGFHWESSVGGFLSDQRQFNTTSLANGTHRITLSVMDNFGMWSGNAISNVTINGLPIAEIVSIIPPVANESEPVNFTGHYTDFEFDIAAWHWESDLDGLLGDEMMFTSTSLSNGTHVISLRVMDGHGAWSDNDTAVIMVNGRPIARIDSISPEIPNEDSNVTFYGSYLDFEGHVEGFHWSSDVAGILSEEFHFETDNLSAGDHNITFRVMDGNGFWSKNVTRTLIVNGIPTAEIVSVVPSPATEGRIVNLTGGYYDLEENVISFHWESDIDGTIGVTLNLWTEGLSNGTHNISFRVMDHRGVWSTDAVEMLLVNGMPRARLSIVAPSPTYRGDLVQLTSSVTDDGVIDKYDWRSSLDGTLGNSAGIETDELSVGTHTIALKVRDDLGEWSSNATVSLQVLERIYRVEIINIMHPSTARAGETIVATASVQNTCAFDITGLRVRLMVDGTTISLVIDDTLEPEMMTNVTFEWTAVKGNYTISAVAVIDGELLDTKVSPVRLMVTETPPPKGDGSDGSLPILVIILGIMTIEVVLILLIIVRYLYTKR